MIPITFLLIVLGLIVLDFMLDLQLFAFSLAMTIATVGIFEYANIALEGWKFPVFFVFLMVLFVVITRFFIKKDDSPDINKY